jgi:hypothetical protein
VDAAFVIGDSGAFLLPAKLPIGRPFAPTNECLLLPGIHAAALAISRKDRRIILFSELRGPYGVADLAVLETDDEVLADRLALGIPPLLNQLDAAIVASLAVHKPRSLSTVALRLGWHERHLSTRIEQLRRVGAVARLPSGCFVRPRGLQPLGYLSAYEAKVTDWKKGFLQAATYATWADEATLAAGRLPRDPSRALAMAADLRLGVIADGIWQRRPERQRLLPQTRLWASEYVVAAMP